MLLLSFFSIFLFSSSQSSPRHLLIETEDDVGGSDEFDYKEQGIDYEGSKPFYGRIFTVDHKKNEIKIRWNPHLHKDEKDLCQCNGVVTGNNTGECRTKIDGKPFCYVDKGKCADEKQSPDDSRLYMSTKACPNMNGAVARCGPDKPRKINELKEWHNPTNETCEVKREVCSYGMQCCKDGILKDICVPEYNLLCDFNLKTKVWSWDLHKQPLKCDKRNIVPQGVTDETCICNGVVLQSKEGLWNKGQCRSKIDGKPFCFVEKSNCKDAKQDPDNPTLYMSKKACSYGDLSLGPDGVSCSDTPPKTNDTCTTELLTCHYGKLCCKTRTWENRCGEALRAWCLRSEDRKKLVWKVQHRLCDGDVGCLPEYWTKKEDPNTCCGDPHCSSHHPKLEE